MIKKFINFLIILNVVFFSIFSLGFSYDSDLGGSDVLVLDEIKIYNIALNDSQVKDLYLNQFRSIVLSTNVVRYDRAANELDIDVTFPFIDKSSDLMCYMYYSSK